MKIKYIGNFTDGTGWAKASTYNALALHHAGYDVYCEEFKYNESKHPLEPELEDLLAKKSESYDVIVNHVLPRDYKYIGGVKNIGFVELETLNLSSVPWIKNLKIMDHMLVANKASQRTLAKLGIESNIFPHSFNFEKVSTLQGMASINQLNNNFNFMFIGEFSKRKNLEAVLRAFHSEFEYFENVNLYIKTSGITLESLTNFCTEVKNKIKKNGKCKTEVILCDYVSEDILLSTMKQCHASVVPSYGEAWCYPAIEAMAMGIPCIYTKGIGIEDYGIGFKVDSYEVPCYGATDNMSDIYTCEDTWLEIDVKDLQNKMRTVHNMFISDKRSYENMSKNCITTASMFNYKDNNFTKGLL
jgi:glycosyltransferase involved in cell wall biosynthesis